MLTYDLSPQRVCGLLGKQKSCFAVQRGCYVEPMHCPQKHRSILGTTTELERLPEQDLSKATTAEPRVKEKPSELRRGRIRFHNGDATIYFTIGLDEPNPFPWILAQGEIRKGMSNVGIKGMIPSILGGVKRPMEIGNATEVAGLQPVPDVSTLDSIGHRINVHRFPFFARQSQGGERRFCAWGRTKLSP